MKRRYWSDADVAYLRASYANVTTNEDLPLATIAKKLGRDKRNVNRKARELGLTNRSRPKVRQRGLQLWGPKLGAEGSAEHRAGLSAQSKRWLQTHPHPKGFAGRKHSATSRAAMGEKVRAAFARRTPLQEAIRHAKRNATNLDRYGTGSPNLLRGGDAVYSRTKSGKRPDLNNRYFRSRWEANYARYLNWLMVRGEIREWTYEPRTFVFHGVTRGVLTYTPDFCVTENNGQAAYHEVKGWMDAASKAKLRRMHEFYPEERLILIQRAEYAAITKWSRLISGWESGR